MASLLSPRRGAPSIRLTATVPQEEGTEPSPEEPEVHPLGWMVMALVGGVAAAGFGWVIMAGLTVLGWLAAEPGSLGMSLQLGTRFWLLGNGAGATIGTLNVTLLPLAATLVFAVMLNGFAALAARHALSAGLRPASVVLRIIGSTALGYTLPVTIAAGVIGGSGPAVRGFVGAAVTAAVAAAWGSCRTLGFRPTHLLPDWARSVPYAVAGALLVMLTVGAGTVVTSLIVHRDRVIQLHDALNAGAAGGIALLMLQLAFAPNVVIWAASYTLGAGFSVGDGSLVSPVATDIGMLPAFPVLGALPTEGPGSSLALIWLAGGVLAGAMAVYIVMRRRPAARFDETSLVGGLAGALAGLCFVLVGMLSSGDLGSGRLSDLGPPLIPLLVMAVTLMGLSGLITGLAFGLIRRPRTTAGRSEDEGTPAEEETIALEDQTGEDETG